MIVLINRYSYLFSLLYFAQMILAFPCGFWNFKSCSCIGSNFCMWKRKWDVKIKIPVWNILLVASVRLGIHVSCHCHLRSHVIYLLVAVELFQTAVLNKQFSSLAYKFRLFLVQRINPYKGFISIKLQWIVLVDGIMGDWGEWYRQYLIEKIVICIV